MKHPQCRICTDDRRRDLESELADGARIRACASKHQVSYHSLARHWRNHLTPEQKDRLRFGDAPAHRLKGMVADEGISVLKDLDTARKAILEGLDAAPAADAHARGILTGRLHENTRLRGQISGELAKSPLITQQNLTVVMQSPQLADFMKELAAALRPWPDAVRAARTWLEARQAQALGAASSDTLPERPALEHVP